MERPLPVSGGGGGGARALLGTGGGCDHCSGLGGVCKMLPLLSRPWPDLDRGPGGVLGLRFTRIWELVASASGTVSGALDGRIAGLRVGFALGDEEQTCLHCYRGWPWVVGRAAAWASLGMLRCLGGGPRGFARVEALDSLASHGLWNRRTSSFRQDNTPYLLCNRLIRSPLRGT